MVRSWPARTVAASRAELEELVAAWIEVAGADRVQLRLEGAAARVAEQAHAARRRT